MGDSEALKEDIDNIEMNNRVCATIQNQCRKD
jgi:hypothetical protein